METVRVLFFLGVTFLALGGTNAAPRRYDQRQEGEFNVHAQLENFLFVVAIPSNNDVLSELALQALELKQHLGSSGGIIPPLPSKDHELDATFSESNDEEIYITTTDAVQISEDRSDKKDPPQNTGEENTEVSSTSSQQQQATTASTDEKMRREKAENVVRTAKSAKNFKPTKSREMPMILGYLVDPRTLGFEMEEGGRARNVIRNIWNSEESDRPDTSMKKQLFRRGLGEQDITLSPNTNENNAMFVGEKQQELRLLGDGIENCGPGRRRDASGLCEFDESDDSFV